MPSSSNDEMPHSQDIITGLLSEARHLVVRERATEDDNLLQIQQVIEAAQRELRRLRIRSSVESSGNTSARENTSIEVGEVEESVQENRGRNNPNQDINGSTDDEEDGVARMIAGLEQISITPGGQSSEFNEQTRADASQENAPSTELDLYLGHPTSWTWLGVEDLLRQLPRYEEIWRPQASSPEAQQVETQNDTTVNEELSGDEGSWVASNEEAARTVEGEEGRVNLARPGVEDPAPESPSAGLAFFDPTGRSLVYTDLSRLQRERSFANFTDRHIGRASSSSLPGPGNVLDQIPSDGDTWTASLEPGAQEDSERMEIERQSGDRSSHEDSVRYYVDFDSWGYEDTGSGSSYEISRTTSPLHRENESHSSTGATFQDLGPLSSFPTPSQSPMPSLHRENTSLSSTGATTGSSMVLEQEQEEPTKKDQSPFTKERRVQLMTAMTADIAQYSQEREWSFYQEHRYCAFPRVVSPEPERERQNRGRSTRASGNSEVGSRVMRALRRSRRENNRTTWPAESFDQRPVHELPNPSENFLRYLLAQTEMTREQEARREEEQSPQFEEHSVPIDRARFRYSLVHESMDGPPSEDQRLAFGQLVDLLRGEETSRIMVIEAGGESPFSTMILAAQRDGMDIREAMRFVIEWYLWPNSDRVLYRDIPGFIPVSVMQFWTALRRGWGDWHPSQRILHEVRDALQYNESFVHTPNIWGIETPSEGLRFVAVSRIRERLSAPEERGRLMRLLDQGISEARVIQLLENWCVFILGEMQVPTRLFSESHFSTQQLRLDRLERIIREERMMNAPRRVRGPEGQWTE